MIVQFNSFTILEDTFKGMLRKIIIRFLIQVRIVLSNFGLHNYTNLANLISLFFQLTISVNIMMKLKYFHDATYPKKSLPFQTRYFHNCDLVNALNGQQVRTILKYKPEY